MPVSAKLDWARAVPEPLPPEITVVQRIALTVFAALACQIGSVFGITRYSAVWLIFGIALSHIWSTFPLQEKTDRPGKSSSSPSQIAKGVQQSIATTRKNTQKIAENLKSTSVGTDEVSDPSPAPEDVTLEFEAVEGAQLVGKNNYTLNYPFSTVVAATLSKFPKLPCPEEPDLLSIEVETEVNVSPSIVQRKRVFTTRNTMPSALINFMGMGETVVTDERSLERRDENGNSCMAFISENREFRNICHVQVHEEIKSDPKNESRTVIASETWLATPGLYWPLTTTAVSFAKSQQKEKSAISRKLLEKRCAEIDAGGIENDKAQIVESQNDSGVKLASTVKAAQKEREARPV